MAAGDLLRTWVVVGWQAYNASRFVSTMVVTRQPKGRLDGVDEVVAI
jgi:hypothetical protein